MRSIHPNESEKKISYSIHLPKYYIFENLNQKIKKVSKKFKNHIEYKYRIVWGNMLNNRENFVPIKTMNF